MRVFYTLPTHGCVLVGPVTSPAFRVPRGRSSLATLPAHGLCTFVTHHLTDMYPLDALCMLFLTPGEVSSRAELSPASRDAWASATSLAQVDAPPGAGASTEGAPAQGRGPVDIAHLRVCFVDDEAANSRWVPAYSWQLVRVMLFRLLQPVHLQNSCCV